MKKNKEFNTYINTIRDGSRVDEMKNYIQHGTISTYEHSYSVAYMSYVINKKLRLHSSVEELVRGAFLHDYFLYDWHDWEGELHGFYHPQKALENAREDFNLTHKEENIIRSHMWPLTFRNYPKSREAAIVCVADKIVSTNETLFKRRKIPR